MARDIDLGPLPQNDPDRVGSIQLRADPRRRRVVHNPPGAFVDLKRQAAEEAVRASPWDFRVTLRVVELVERRESRLMHSVGLSRAGHFMGLRARRDLGRALCYAIYLCVMLRVEYIYLDGQGTCAGGDDGAAWVVDAGAGAFHGIRLPLDVLEPVEGMSEGGWQAFRIRDFASMMDRGPEEVYEEFLRSCSVDEL